MIQDEQDIFDSYNQNEWHPVANVEDEMQQYRAYAAETLRQHASVPVQFSEDELEEPNVRSGDDQHI